MSLEALKRSGIGTSFHNQNLRELPGGSELAVWFQTSGVDLLESGAGFIYHVAHQEYAYELFVLLAKASIEAGFETSVTRLDAYVRALKGEDTERGRNLCADVLFLHPFQGEGECPLSPQELMVAETAILERLDNNQAVVLCVSAWAWDLPWWSDYFAARLFSAIDFKGPGTALL